MNAPTTITPLSFHEIRSAVLAELDKEVLLSRQSAGDGHSLPEHLLNALLWLADHGIETEPSDGERYFCWPAETCRLYLDRLTAEQEARRIEAGRIAIEQIVASPLLEAIPSPVHGFLIEERL